MVVDDVAVELRMSPCYPPAPYIVAAVSVYVSSFAVRVTESFTPLSYSHIEHRDEHTTLVSTLSLTH